MADFSIQLDVDDARVNEFIAALRHHYGPVGNPPRDRTPAELKAGVKNDLREMLIGWFREYRVYQRENDDPGIT